MRIVHLSYSTIPAHDDPGKWLKQISFLTGILEGMAGYAEVVSIYNMRYSGVQKKAGVTYHFPNYSQWELVIPLRFNRFVKRLNPDVVIVHGLISPWQVILLRWQIGSKLKIIVQHHAERPFRYLRRYFQRWADRYIGAYLFSSVYLGKKWVERGQIRDPGKIKEILGMSSPFYVISKEQARKFTRASGDPTYVWVGDLDRNKDPLMAARAFIHFHAGNPSAKLYMIYQTFPLLDELSAIVAGSRDDSPGIQLIGKVDHDDLLYWYNSADFIISSSHYEGAGIAVCEALSCGCIPILTDIPSFRTMTHQGRLGLLYEAGDEDKLINSLNQSLALDREEQKKSVLEHFNKQLSFEANVKGIMEVVNSL